MIITKKIEVKYTPRCESGTSMFQKIETIEESVDDFIKVNNITEIISKEYSNNTCLLTYNQ